MFADIKIQLYINIIDILKAKHKDTMVKGDIIYFNNNVMTATEDKNVITISLTNRPSNITVTQNITWFELERSLDDIIKSLFLDMNNYIESLRIETVDGIRESILGVFNIPKRDIKKIDDFTIKIPIEEDFVMRYEVHREFVRSIVDTKDLNSLSIDTPIGKFIPEYLIGYIVPTMQNFRINTR